MKEDEKSQNKSSNSSDEIDVQAGNKALFFAVLVATILMVAKLIANESWYDSYSVILMAIGVIRLYKGIKLHQKSEIALGVLFCILSLILLFTYLFHILS